MTEATEILSEKNISSSGVEEVVKNPVRATKDSSEEVLREMSLQKVRERLEIFQSEILHHVDKKLEVMVEDVLNEVKKFDLQNNELKQLFNDQNGKLANNRKKTDKPGTLPEKEFIHRNSLLNDLFEVKHIKTIYDIFIVILIILMLNTLVHDFVVEGTINMGHNLIIAGFSKFHLVFLIWFCMQIVTIAVYPFFLIWAKSRPGLKRSKSSCKTWDTCWIFGVIAYQLLFMTYGVKALLLADLPLASSAIVMMEMVRFVMKSHAFIRSNVPRVLAGKLKTETNDEKVHVPDFSKYLYFLFVPTLIYQDNYPRNKQIRWKKVAWNFAEVLGVIFYVSFIFERFLNPFYKQFGEKPLQPGTLVLSIFGSMMPSMLVFLCGFYCLLHAWMNAFAELLRFGDKMFYKDWWNAYSFDVYYRTWNVVVHDWLYTYIYKDCYENVFKGNKTVSALIVFTVSALVHEFIMGFIFGYFYPVMFVLFQGAGVGMMFIPNRKHKTLGNICMWLFLCVGNGIMFSMYCMEYFARKNCPDSDNLFFVPVSWTCHGIVDNPNWKIKVPWY